MVKHQETHPDLDVPGCFGCRCASVNFGAALTPNRRPEANNKIAMEERWNRDIPAYKTLVKQGIQPQRIDGCADLAARAKSKSEIEAGRLAPSGH